MKLRHEKRAKPCGFLHLSLVSCASDSSDQSQHRRRDSWGRRSHDFPHGKALLLRAAAAVKGSSCCCIVDQGANNSYHYMGSTASDTGGGFFSGLSTSPMGWLEGSADAIPWKNQVVFPADCLSAVIVFCKPLATASESGRVIYSV